MKAVVWASLTALIGAGGSAQAYTNSSLSGTYACTLNGSFLLQPFSISTITFTSDSKGSIDGIGNVSTALAVKAGSMNVQMNEFGTEQTPAPSKPAFYFGELLNETCNFLLQGGNYQIGPEGRGTMSLNWTARTGNSNSPVDCTVNINSSSFQVLLTSTSALYLVESDAASSGCGPGTLNYTTCGALMSGTCTKQSGVTFPKTVPTP